MTLSSKNVIAKSRDADISLKNNNPILRDLYRLSNESKPEFRDLCHSEWDYEVTTSQIQFKNKKESMKLWPIMQTHDFKSITCNGFDKQIRNNRYMQ